MRRVAALFGGWRGLGRFWALILLGLIAGAATLHLLGPAPDEPRPSAHAPALKPEPPIAKRGALPEPEVLHPAPPRTGKPEERPGRDEPGPVNDPEPALLEPAPGALTGSLPHIAADGRKPMRYYAAGFDPTSVRPRVGLLVAGIGPGFADSKKAITDLPAQVTFAVSPYVTNPEPLLSLVRLRGHEYLLSIPMEPSRFPLNDPGPNALMTNQSPAQNQPKLLWALSRLEGYAGVTDILGAMRGERLADMPEQMDPILAELDRRGLMYVAAPGQASPVPHAWSKVVDVVIDEPATAADIDAHLAILEAKARDRGAALGVAVAPRPVTVERVAAWASGLANRGMALAPVSALMIPPEDQPK